MTTVLVVDDDPTVREVVATYLRRDGLDVLEAADGPAALAADADAEPDLVVLDLMLPGLDGLEVFRRLRARRGGVPVVMLTARGDEADRVLGLEVGADDYVAKPFSPRELVLRIQALLRRSAPSATPAEVLTDGDLVIDTRARTVTRGGDALQLTAREFDLLRHLVATAGTVWSRTELMNDVWGWEYGDESTVTVHVRRLREKVEAEPSKPRRLVTVWGVGYRWDPDGA
ncbi:response regulator [Nocardioides sp.]|uniref:response regulator n=1 Tax=Nocardioides sp. TaxID=35761 RepID=UPI003528060A